MFETARAGDGATWTCAGVRCGLKVVSGVIADFLTSHSSDLTQTLGSDHIFCMHNVRCCLRWWCRPADGLDLLPLSDS